MVDAGLGAHRGDQVVVADQAARLAADHPQMAQGQVHAVLGRRADVVIGLGRYREFGDVRAGAEQKFQRWQPCLAVVGQRQHDYLGRLFFVPGEEIADRLQAELLVHGQQVHVQHQQIPPHHASPSPARCRLAC